MRIAFVYNAPTEDLLLENAEYTINMADSWETIQAVTEALESGGHSVTGLNADVHLPAKLSEAAQDGRFDIVFNIATGMYGTLPQVHVPAMLEYLRIPHTGSPILAETLCHHKPTVKLVLRAAKLNTPASQLFTHGDEPITADLRFPLIVKLPAEGGSLGMDYNSVVDDEAALRIQLHRMIGTYHEGALVEEYLDGREFTVPVLGNDPPYTLSIGELHFWGERNIRLDEADPTTLERLNKMTGQNIPFVATACETRAPADVTPGLAAELQQTALNAYRAIGCQDWARVDLRMDSQGRVHVIDINLEPGIAPDYAVAKCAYASSWTFTELIHRILDHAVQRYPALSHEKPAR
ncbi:MAG TPA: hypothetical protein VKQ72_20465 [Aggregatilineales bacterium]|nr:hypothetical protein [Aggregatilineales bacterium]